MGDKDYVVHGFGRTTYGQLGIGKFDEDSSSVQSHDRTQPTPIIVPTPEPIKEISCGRFDSLFLDYNGTVYGSGSNSQGEIGQGDIKSCFTLEVILDLEDIISIKCSSQSSFVLNSNRELFVFGLNYNGKLTLPSKVKCVKKPQKISLPLTSEIKSITCGINDVRILETNGDVWSFGKTNVLGDRIVNGRLLEGKSIEYISDGGRHFFMKSSNCTYGFG